MSGKRKHRILFDLSPALLEFAGIPQTTRQLFDLLSRSPDFEVTGLIWGHSTACLLHRFYNGKAHHRRLENEAEFLHAMLWHLSPDPETRSERISKELRRDWRIWTQKRFRCHTLDPVWADWVWRYYFAPTLPSSARERLAKVPYAVTTLTRFYLRERLQKSLPLPVLDTREYDTLFLQYPFALRTTPGTRKVIRCQDLVPLLYFDTQPESSQAIRFHQRSISSSAKDGLFVTATTPTEQGLHTVFPGLSLQSRTIPHFVNPPISTASTPASLDRILKNRVCMATQPEPRYAPVPITGEELVKNGYFIAVSTLEPRKNWLSLFQAFSILRSRHTTSVRLVVVGSPGWKFEPILAALRPMVKSGEVLHLSQVNRLELDTLYRHALALIYPSYHEGFGLPPLEAAQQGTPAVLSDIPVHRWVMEEGALYCDPHNPVDIARAMSELLPRSPEAADLRAGLVAKAQKRLALYSEEKALHHWQEVLLDAPARNGT